MRRRASLLWQLGCDPWSPVCSMSVAFRESKRHTQAQTPHSSCVTSWPRLCHSALLQGSDRHLHLRGETVLQRQKDSVPLTRSEACSPVEPEPRRFSRSRTSDRGLTKHRGSRRWDPCDGSNGGGRLSPARKATGSLFASGLSSGRGQYAPCRRRSLGSYSWVAFVALATNHGIASDRQAHNL